jgi:pyridoxine 5-phosphate synthase
MLRFSVNLNKFALLRNSRGMNVPSVVAIARRCLSAGVHGITLHPRPDQRHARYSDVFEVATLLEEFAHAELNIEGAPTDAFLDVLLRARPHQCTLVPDAPDQLTSDHGWKVGPEAGVLESAVERLHEAGVRVSLFMDPVAVEVEAAAGVGADRIELYTASYARAFATPEREPVTDSFCKAARAATRAGLGVNAGHDLNLQNLRFFLDHVPGVLEVSIGHAFICECFDYTLEGTVARYLELMKSVSSSNG